DGSKNLALAFGTLFGSVLFFGTQVWFDLQPTTETAQISFRYTVDRSKPDIRQWRRPRGLRAAGETGASDWLAEKNQKILRSTADSTKTATDLTMFSLLYMLGTQEIDWQMRETVYQDEYVRRWARQGISAPSQCTRFSAEDIKSILCRTKNLFAG